MKQMVYENTLKHAPSDAADEGRIKRIETMPVADRIAALEEKMNKVIKRAHASNSMLSAERCTRAMTILSLLVSLAHVERCQDEPGIDRKLLNQAIERITDVLECELVPAFIEGKRSES